MKRDKRSPIAKARDKWLKSKTGLRCIGYNLNMCVLDRVWVAFNAGYRAGSAAGRKGWR